MKRPFRTRKVAVGRKAGETDPRKRGWPVALAWAGALVGVLVVLSAVVNPLIERSVHWNWMAGLAPTLLVVLTLAIRWRWV